jgi:hypothetical protein
MDLLLTIEIKDYIRKVKLSDSRRAKYFKQKDILPYKYLNPNIIFGSSKIDNPNAIHWGESKDNRRFALKEEYIWKWHKIGKDRGEFRLALWDEYVIKNTRVAGSEKWETINSQKIYSGVYHPQVTAKIVKAIKQQLMAEVHLSMGEPIDTFPIRVLMEIHDTVIDSNNKTGSDFDIDNRGYIYGKCFMDVITGFYIHKSTDEYKATLEKDDNPNNYKLIYLIPDDHRAYVTQPPTPLFCPINEGDTPKLVFKIYADRRTGLESLHLYRKGRKATRTDRRSF